MTLADLRSDVLGITRLSDDGWSYYLPSYLLNSLSEYSRMDFVVDSLLESLISPEYGVLTDDEFALLERSRDKSEFREDLKMISLQAKPEANNPELRRTFLERYRQRFAHLTIQKLDAILLFLRWVRQEHAGETSSSLLSKAEMSVLEILESRGCNQ